MKIRNTVCSIAAVAIASLAAATVSAQDGTLNNDLFAQYYTQPGASQVHAEMYPAPLPVPAHVGHSYYTYQPLMPHEMMYQHTRNYYNYYAGPDAFYGNGTCRWPCGGAMTKTKVRWQSAGMYFNMTGNCRAFANLQYKWAKHRYTAREPGFGHGCGGCGKFGCHSCGGKFRCHGCGKLGCRGGCGHCAGGNCGGGDCATGNCGNGAVTVGSGY